MTQAEKQAIMKEYATHEATPVRRRFKSLFSPKENQRPHRASQGASQGPSLKKRPS